MYTAQQYHGDYSDGNTKQPVEFRNVIAIDESLPEDVVSFFDAFGNATHTALMFNLVGEDVLITGAL